MRTIDSNEYLEILNELDYKHGSFYHLWEMGRPRFVEGTEALDVVTGAVSFNREGKFLEFLINEDFWKTLNLHQKTFVLAHECLHVTYNHGYRLFRHAKTALDARLMNYACDIVINHRLVELGFDRDIIDPASVYCWLDTVFPEDMDILPNRSSEYYYSKLKEMEDEQIEKLELSIQTVDQHGTGEGESEGEFEDMASIIEELIESISDEEKNDLAADFEKNHKELDQKINDQVDQDKAGTAPSGILKQVDLSQRVVRKDKWETVIKKWVQKTRLDDMKVEEQWARTARMFNALSSDLMLPSEMETGEPLIEKHKVKVYFFLDTSYSCKKYANRFWKAARSVPEKYFDVRLFCFDTSVYETTLESGKLYGFGGTSFSPIEKHIQHIMNSETSKYPDVVFLITDGYGDRVYPEIPDRWHWFMTPNYTKSYVPSGSHLHKLEDFE